MLSSPPPLDFNFEEDLQHDWHPGVEGSQRREPIRTGNLSSPKTSRNSSEAASATTSAARKSPLRLRCTPPA